MSCFASCISAWFNGYDTYRTIEKSRDGWIEHGKSRIRLETDYPPIEISFDPLKTFPENFPKVEENKITSDFLGKHVFIHKGTPESKKCKFHIEHSGEAVTSVGRSYIDTVTALQRYVTKTQKPILMAEIWPAED
jgi:hypothetical protein